MMGNDVPETGWSVKIPNVENFKVFGAKAFVAIPKRQVGSEDLVWTNGWVQQGAEWLQDL